jgi:hypothetical protein
MDKTIWKRLSQACLDPEFFIRVRDTDHEAIYNLCLILKKGVVKVMPNCNTVLVAAAFSYIQIQLHVP